MESECASRLDFAHDLIHACWFGHAATELSVSFADVLDDTAASPVREPTPDDLEQIGLLVDRQMLNGLQDFVKCDLCHAIAFHRAIYQFRVALVSRMSNWWAEGNRCLRANPKIILCGAEMSANGYW